MEKSPWIQGDFLFVAGAGSMEGRTRALFWTLSASGDPLTAERTSAQPTRLSRQKTFFPSENVLKVHDCPMPWSRYSSVKLPSLPDCSPPVTYFRSEIAFAQALLK
jgi:hypothetical protein